MLTSHRHIISNGGVNSITASIYGNESINAVVTYIFNANLPGDKFMDSFHTTETILIPPYKMLSINIRLLHETTFCWNGEKRSLNTY